MLLAEVAAASRDVAATRSRNAKAERLAALLAALAPEEVTVAVSYLAGEVPQGRIGVGPALLRKVLPSPGRAAEGSGGEAGSGAAAEPGLTLGEVDATFTRIAQASGAGSGAERERLLGNLLARATVAEQELLAAVGALPVDEAILDGEVLALAPDGRPHPFQVTMRRFGRRQDDAVLRRELPLSPFFFDLLAADGDELLLRPEADRAAALADLLPGELLMPRLVTADPAEAAELLDGAIRRGHEGVMAKALDAPYEAGSRGSGWLKVKPAYTLDLVVLAAEWGSGRRRGWLSNLHLGARDPGAGPGGTDAWVMLGKTFKGMTDEMLAWQTERLQQLEVARDGHTVYVRPELVVEIAFNDVQSSPHYPAGLALRFARVKRYRTDKPVEEADTVATVRALHPGG